MRYIRNSIVYFVIVTALIFFLFPREGTFRYAFVEGKPWQYGLLTAPFDFPVYKSPEQLKAEQDSVIQQFVPYFQFHREIHLQQQERFNDAYTHYSKEYWNNAYKSYVDKTLKEIYALGIVSNEDYHFLRDNHYDAFRVLQENNKTALHSTNDVFTIKAAYSYILDNCPKNLTMNVLRSVDLNDFLHENLKYDQSLSDKVKQEDLQRVAVPNGMVQAGEKIADKGEIVTPHTYDILCSFKKIQEESGSVQRQTGLMAGIAILIAGLMTCLLLYLIYFRKRIYANQKDVVFLFSMAALFILLTEVARNTGLFSVYIVPYAIIPIVIRTFFESRTAQITHLITILICSLMLPFAFEFILIQFFVCTVALYVLKDLTKRSELIRCAIFILTTYAVSYIGLQLFQEGELTKIDWNMFIYFGINFVFVMFTYAFIYIVEKIFGYISNVTLVELSDINLPALMQLAEKCPGTFQHSLQVSMLGTAAAAKVGANPQLIRTGALYHDLGKMENPAYFTENEMSGANPHDQLTLEQSARIITHHVPAGIKIAQKFGLPPAIAKFILTHHGTGKAKYFYNSFKNRYPNEPIDEEAFSYAGSNPDTKETAILMMADSVEAASRSLKDYREETIRELVNRIIEGQIADGLLNNAPLTFQNITSIKNVFVEKLLSVYHSRISYPELAKNPAGSSGDAPKSHS
ncbi:MAG: HDIG domain-containing protein [Dysgonamonadaceae bacterium]|jgi:putative nucleotidyltransferase with HDIG domain|nr:HDIG domain-containing protein [Dysgonamonadaceae bacterium]